MKTQTILSSILGYSIQQKASDIHISSGKPVSYRIKKHLVTMTQA
jgi:Tfp pilus assembly pilus retraction ATPase PilT